MALPLLLCAASCDDTVPLDGYHSVAAGGWGREDTVVFRIDTIAREGVYGETVGIRISDDYPFSNLTVIVEQSLLAGGTVRVDTLDCTFADEHGRLSGTGISYHLYEFPLCTLQLRQSDSLRVTIRHDMRQERLYGIADVGFRVSLSRRQSLPETLDDMLNR